MRLAQAQLDLAGALQQARWVDGVAGVLRIEAVDRRAVIGAQCQKGADPFHLVRILSGRWSPNGSRRRCNEPACCGAGSSVKEMKIPATTYFPRELPPKY